MMKPLSASFIIEFYAQAQDFAMAKIPRTGCHKTASPSIVIRKGKVNFSPSNDHALRNFKKILCFHNDTIQINNIKVSMSVVMGILNLSSIDIAQEMFFYFNILHIPIDH